jgi:S1-C subfamily serine protease
MFGIPQAGLILSEKGKSVVVKDVLPDPQTEVRGEAKQGDVVVKINGSPVSSLKEFRTAYEKLPVGSKIQLGTSRSGKDLKLEFAKPKDDGKMIIRRQVN